MLTIIPLLTALIFAAIYPLCFWISRKDPLKNDFHKFHLGLPNFVGGVAVLWLLTMDVPLFIKGIALLWKIIFLSISYSYWKRGNVNPRILSIPCLLGIFVFCLVEFHLVILRFEPEFLSGFALYSVFFSSILAGLILCSALYAMNLGHWYLNVHGLPLHHLRRAVYVFWFFVIIRALWDSVMFIINPVLFQGEMVSLVRFIGSMEGVFLSIALFFGTLFPIVALWFVKGTIDVKSTQSATGILYVIVSAILLGDIAYKYYLIRFGLGL